MVTLILLLVGIGFIAAVVGRIMRLPLWAIVLLGGASGFIIGSYWSV